MCGRYASSRKPDDLVEHFEVADVRSDTLPACYNVAPTTEQYVVLERLVDDDVSRQLRALRWGLVPSWASDISVGNRMINARAETLTAKPAFRTALARRRCLVPADGYFEWLRSPNGKQPFFIRRRDAEPLAMAGLYELWSPRDSDEPPLWSFTIVTTAANDALRHIHDRMPVLVPRPDWPSWLDPTSHDADLAAALLVAAPPELVEAFPVSTAVNSVANDGPALVEPLPAELDAPADTLF